ncbi:hypothetical protein EON65_05360 [archaeon]|nr:MAG: hypothetical protein EON65_05360 [archaeon]
MNERRIMKVCLLYQDLLAFTALERLDAAQDKDKLEQDKQMLPGPVQSFYISPIGMLHTYCILLSSIQCMRLYVCCVCYCMMGVVILSRHQALLCMFNHM